MWSCTQHTHTRPDTFRCVQQKFSGYFEPSACFTFCYVSPLSVSLSLPFSLLHARTHILTDMPDIAVPVRCRSPVSVTFHRAQSNFSSCVYDDEYGCWLFFLFSFSHRSPQRRSARNKFNVYIWIMHQMMLGQVFWCYLFTFLFSVCLSLDGVSAFF